MSSIPLGTKVRQVVPVIEGVVIDRRQQPDGEEDEVLVAYIDAEGDEHTRWFAVSQVTQEIAS
jgi:hypothetical protein